jgi:hypothetical protein
MVSLLWYQNFETDAHPILSHSWSLDLDSGEIKHRSYLFQNAPILHRKELFVYCDDLQRKEWAALTAEEEKAGLFENSKTIGYQNQWQALLKWKILRIKSQKLIGVENAQSSI